MRLASVVLALPLLCLELWAQPQLSSAPPPATTALTLAVALQLARVNSVQFSSARADAALAKEDRVQARSTLLPTVSYNNQFLYTQGNGTPTGRFLANNAVHEYVSQGNAHEVISLAQFADYRKSGALAALARARAEVASRGLVVTVFEDFYAVLGSQRKVANAKIARDEASRFLELSQKLERGGEVAHSDVLKAQLQFNDRRRELGDSESELVKSRMELAVLILPNVTGELKLADDLDERPLLPSFAEVRKAAAEKNPELKAAMAALRASQEEVTAARAEHLPSLSLDYFYGIDASHFATRTDGVRNLGYAASATLNIPVFSWGSTQSKVRQSLIRKDQARLELTTAQKQLLANTETFYKEAQTAASQLDTLGESVEVATESLRLITLRYQAGESSVLEVVDAQNTLNAARNAFVDGSRHYRIALANLQTLTGTI
ncbi:MAG TPA: TolC family protein [Candidatus Saccharimonadales bacterium]|nr:TolC family protein [Candidatus Saccharimonadales bacterium]